MKLLGLWLVLISCLILWNIPSNVYASEASGSGSTRQESCEVMKIALQKKAGKLLNKAKQYAIVFDAAAEKNEKQVDQALLQTKHRVLMASLSTTERDIASISCPTSQLHMTMMKVEQDLREVNQALRDYRRTIKGLTGKPESVLGAQTKQSVASCTALQVTAKKQVMTTLIDSAQTLALKYAKRAKVSGAFPSAIVQTRRLAFESALQKARQDMVLLSCENGSMYPSLQTFKTDMQVALIALKSYRQALLDTTVDSQQTDLEQAVQSLPVVN